MNVGKNMKNIRSPKYSSPLWQFASSACYKCNWILNHNIHTHTHIWLATLVSAYQISLSRLGAMKLSLYKKSCETLKVKVVI